MLAERFILKNFQEERFGFDYSTEGKPFMFAMLKGMQ
jgi:hypothetical protein